MHFSQRSTVSELSHFANQKSDRWDTDRIKKCHPLYKKTKSDPSYNPPIVVFHVYLHAATLAPLGLILRNIDLTSCTQCLHSKCFLCSHAGQSLAGEKKKNFSTELRNAETTVSKSCVFLL
uniref:Uncharacterized protein n=1 Tax=Pyxicephalus adspersus TaxID=30357 RepID=A0AAV2ZTA5_PYXAD|nr:TPA: hypothetical protein GDO54_016140 [Pyxicephalus adspersus]